MYQLPLEQKNLKITGQKAQKKDYPYNNTPAIVCWSYCRNGPGSSHVIGIEVVIHKVWGGRTHVYWDTTPT